MFCAIYILTAFDNEDEAEKYCDGHVEYQQHGDEEIELEIRYDEIA